MQNNNYNISIIINLNTFSTYVHFGRCLKHFTITDQNKNVFREKLPQLKKGEVFYPPWNERHWSYS